MSTRKTTAKNGKRQADQVDVEALLAGLSRAGRRRYLEMALATDFLAFVSKVFETVSPGAIFRMSWLVEAMAHEAELIIAGKTTRLIVNVPPRHLKTIIFSVALPAFLLGLDPTKRIICISYSSDLAVRFANDFRVVMNSAWYRRVFPNTVISREKDTQTETMTTARGYRYTSSVNGTVTGRGADIIILDDPQKPDESLSEAHRNSVGQWFDTTVLPRLDSKSEGVVVMVMQRCHEDDLAGRLLEKGGWRQLKVAAIAEQDERIQIGNRRVHRRKTGAIIDPRGDTLKNLEDMRRDMGEVFYSAQYQQNPIPLAGNIIKAAWFKDYENAPDIQPRDLIVISIDTAMKGDPGADYSVATIWLSHGDNMYLLDVWRERVDYPALKRAVLRLRETYPGATLLIEDKGSGTSLIQDLRAQDVATIGINPDGDKATRLAKVSAQFESGAVMFPKAAPWLGGLKAELLAFPSVKHDDQVDSVSQALLWNRRRRQNEHKFVVPFVAGTPRYIPGQHSSW
jgi:predicted phage terminase large subunit-like protein